MDCPPATADVMIGEETVAESVVIPDGDTAVG